MKDLDAYARLVQGGKQSPLYLQRYDLEWLTPQELVNLVDITWREAEAYSRKRVSVAPKVRHISLFKRVGASDGKDVQALDVLLAEGYPIRQISYLTGVTSRRLRYCRGREWKHETLRDTPQEKI